MVPHIFIKQCAGIMKLLVEIISHGVLMLRHIKWCRDLKHIALLFTAISQKILQKSFAKVISFIKINNKDTMKMSDIVTCNWTF